MNKDLFFKSSTDEWSTPQTLFDELNKEFHLRWIHVQTKKSKVRKVAEAKRQLKEK